MNEANSIEWQAPEYEEREHGADWFWALGVIIISLAGAAIIYNNYLFAVLVVLAGGTIAMFAVRKPKMVIFSLSDDGINMGDTSYPWRELESFGIDTRRKNEKKLVIRSNKTLMPYIVLPIGEVNEKELRAYIEKKIPDHGHVEPVAHTLFDFLGF